MNEETYTQVMLVVAQVFEVIAAGVLFAGLLWSLWISLRDYRRRRDGGLAYRVMRQSFGGAILLGLEILVAGDLIRTVAVAPTLDNVLVLGIIVLIRTFLSFSLEIEMDGVPPWRKGLVSGASVMARAAASAKPAPG
ncbi:MAG: DUF1622 domain-containing protein [Candidatus Nanopelagicales bacterium]|jgi:uncharacterized membrane protein|uniref:Unannotated protein n=1 Tax=freshwater metagenome TaxID=449393 RepID=A0A6J7IMN0_9ZZZZ